jgi:hypothetical protein
MRAWCARFDRLQDSERRPHVVCWSRSRPREPRPPASGKLQASDTFAQSSYVAWTTNQYTECCVLDSTRGYHTIPASGEGQSGTHYDQTDFQHKSPQIMNWRKTPGGTITFKVFDARGNPTKVYVGTDDTGATVGDLTGGGAQGNNMVLVTENQYDGGSVGGDGNLTQQTQHVDASTTRVTSFTFDWRNRRTDTDGEVDFYEKVYYDCPDFPQRPTFGANRYRLVLPAFMITPPVIHTYWACSAYSCLSPDCFFVPCYGACCCLITSAGPYSPIAMQRLRSFVRSNIQSCCRNTCDGLSREWRHSFKMMNCMETLMHASSFLFRGSCYCA